MFAGMSKRGPKIVLGSMIATESLKIEKQLHKVIADIIESVLTEERELISQLDTFDRPPYNGIDKLAWIADLKIQLKQVKSIKMSILKILRRSSSKLLLASMELESRLS